MAKKTFTGGIHPPGHKHYTQDHPIENVPLSRELFLPLSYDGNSASSPLVSKGARIKRGELLNQDYLPVYSPVNGIVREIIHHPSSKSPYTPTIVIEVDSDIALTSHLPPSTISSTEAFKKLAGGAIPTFTPQLENLTTILQDLPQTDREWCILNGIETEPYLNSERRIMMEFPEEVLGGFKILWEIVGSKQAHIAFLRNHQDMIRQWKKLISNDPKIRVVECELKYPQEAEPVLVPSITGKKIVLEKGKWNRRGLVVNASTAKAVYDWIYRNQMTFSRVLTVAGPNVHQPKNLRVTFGTPVRDVLQLCDIQGTIGKYILGGPLSGTAHFSYDLPVTPDIAGILLFPPEQAVLPEVQPCIHCARCVEVCPTFLIPNELGQAAENEKWKKLKRYHFEACIECGACGYVCPSFIPLVQQIRLGKKKILQVAS